jgi:hypothetical protein
VDHGSRAFDTDTLVSKAADLTYSREGSSDRLPW